MRFIQVLLITMLVWAPVAANSFAQGTSADRTIAAAKSKKDKKAAKGKKAKKTKKDAKAKGKKAKKHAKKAGKKMKKVASAKGMKSHAPAKHAEESADTAGEPANNFEVSPEMQDELPAPNNGNLTD